MQKRLEAARNARYVRFNPEKEVVHNVLSGFLLDPDEFLHLKEPKMDYYRVLFAVLYHHDYGDPWKLIEQNYELIKKLLQGVHTFNIKKNSTKSYVLDMMKDPIAIKVKGYLHKCDYSASGDYISEYPNDFLDQAMKNVLSKWRQNDPDADWNGLQDFCKQKENENIIVIAQTGMGKTEAGFRWIGNNKGFFVLPLRTAINAIYDRVRKDILRNEKIDTRLSILHSESLEYYAKHLKEDNLIEYEKRGKHLSIPLSISTLDQLFDFVFKYQTYELKLTTLSYSKIVIDEIQMYDPELLCFLITGLKMIMEMGGKAAVMTATLPPFIRDLLVENLPFREENIQTFVDDSLRHHMEVREKKINVEEIAEHYCANLKKGVSDKILVVCNTIQKAQELYKGLKERLSDEKNIHILHSRFIKADRAMREKEILEFGKTYDEQGNLDFRAGIWISTSIVGASLDIDFDILFTELQELNSLFQRFGRCNRKGKKTIDSPNCIVYTEIDAKYLTNTPNGFIDSTIFRLSKETLGQGRRYISEAEKIELLNEHFTTEKIRKSDYYKKYENTSQWIEGIRPYEFEKNDCKLRNILSETVIPSPVYEENSQIINELVHQLADPSKSYIDRVKEREKLMQYTVDIPYWHWSKYQVALNDRKVERYPPVRVAEREQIPVMQCEYDDAGYHRMDFEKATAIGEFL